MLINFTVENFLSFKERQQFSMLAGLSGKAKNFHVIPKAHSRDVRLVKTGLVFGANASGKSNLVKAIHTAQQFILEGIGPNTPIEHQPFRLDATCHHRPTRMEFEIKHKGNSYAYGFEFDATTIHGEWLYLIQRDSQKQVFERQHQDFKFGVLKTKNSTPAQQQALELLAQITPSNLLFLTDVRRRGEALGKIIPDISDLEAVIDWFQNALTVIYPETKSLGLEFEVKNDGSLSGIYQEFLRYFDTGIKDIRLKKTKLDRINLPEKVEEHLRVKLLDEHSEKTSVMLDNPVDNIRYLFAKNEDGELTAYKLSTLHPIAGANATDPADALFDLHEESDGTQRIMDFIPMLIDLLKDDNVFIVDEIDRSLHPNLVYDLIDLFLNASEGTACQLIATTHSENLLTQDLLRRDEIWFMEKDSKGASSLYSLDAYDMDIRHDKKIRKDYLFGRYGAVPRTGSRHRLLNAVQPQMNKYTPAS